MEALRLGYEFSPDPVAPAPILVERVLENETEEERG
jgi:hypothetical protein